MKAPIACAFAWPDRLPWPAERLDLAAVAQLTFEAPDTERFPATVIAREAMVLGGGAPAAMNAANEVAVAAFLDRKIGFLDIATLVADTLERMNGLGDLAASGGDALENAAMTDASARRVASSVLDRLSKLHTA
jgi:1-deoxy-D-xylulose-5-phosphate reductoisomerase